MQHQLYICEITTFNQTFRFSSGGEVMIGGNSYIDGLSVDSVNDDEARLTISNVALSASSLFLNYPVRDAEIKINQLIGSTEIPAFVGVGDNLLALDGKSASIRAVSYAGMSRFPSAEVAPPVFNHIPKDGIKISFGGNTIIIGREV